MTFFSFTPPLSLAARLLLVGSLSLASCSLDLPNPNAVTDLQALGTREGIITASVGLRQLYSTSLLESLVVTTGTTSREVKGISTLANVFELELGGTNVSPGNSFSSGLYGRCYRVVNLADLLIAAAPKVLDSDPGTRSGVLAHAYLFKAAALAAVASSFEQGPLAAASDASGANPFATRVQLLADAVRLLGLAKDVLAANPPSADFNTLVKGPALDLPNTIYAYTARFNLMAGNYAAAITAANLVTLSVGSTFVYSGQNANPVYTAVTGATSFRARDRFGLPATLAEPGDGRAGFYLSGPIVVNGTDNVRTLAGFFTTATSPIPAYLPDEMRLIRAECNLRAATPNPAAALVEINAVRTQTTGDPFNIYASLPAYSGPLATADLLLEVYKQRSAELYLSGMRLEDSRRFGRPMPAATPAPTLLERTRNFYPYPQQERINNPNTPADPAI